MGILQLGNYLKKSNPNLFEEIHISFYSYQRIAIDTSLYLCSFKSTYGEDGWLQAFIKLVSCLRKNEVHCVFIYDSGAPPEKEQERKKRRERRHKMEERVFQLEDDLNEYYKTGEVRENLIEFLKTRNNYQKRLLSSNNNKFDEKNAQYHINEKKKQLFELKPEDYEKTKKLFDILKVPYFQAPLEAETMCACLCKRGLVDAVLTEDTDVLAYGTPVWLTKMNVKSETCVRIIYKEVLNHLKMTKEQFLDSCILFGTDYNKRIKNFGPAKIIPYIQTHKNIENVIEILKLNNKFNVDLSNYNRVRELFTKYEQYIIDKIPYCGSPDFDVLITFINNCNIHFSLETIKLSFIHNDLIVIEDECIEDEYKEKVSI